MLPPARNPHAHTCTHTQTHTHAHAHSYMHYISAHTTKYRPTHAYTNKHKHLTMLPPARNTIGNSQKLHGPFGQCQIRIFPRVSKFF